MMSVFPLLLLISIVILGLTVTTDLFAPGLIQEGFTSLGSNPYWAQYVSQRSDFGSDQEDPTVIRDPRYFNDYADVGRIGVAYDFCRMVSDKDEPDALYFACGLAGTDGTSTLSFRTSKSNKGFRLSYDDYMRDINGDGRDDYCRILKWKGDSSWQAVCQRATDTAFEEKETVDADPPPETKTLLSFYQGNVLWLRMMNTMNDYIGNSKVLINGSLTLDETPTRPRLDQASGVQFNGIDQFIRLTDGSDVSLGNKLPMRAVRAVMVWARFDEFTQNAKLFDFGNGKGKDNFFLGILGKGDSVASTGVIRETGCESIGAKRLEHAQACSLGEDSTVPTDPSGSQGAPEMSPQRLMETSAANVNEFDCKGFEVYPRRLTSQQTPDDSLNGTPTVATLIYEVWEKEQRRMRVKVNGVIPLKKWVHICVATTNSDAFRPNLAIYINGEKVVQKESGFLPAASVMTNCYIGKSNWANSVSQYENRDELFKGAMFDFRMYKGMVSEKMIKDSYSWGKAKLGLDE